ncbi:MAG: TlpA family protein disulfide reductase [Deltaproteobacteria bacterium]|nr:TlpA family protein disulfide reductase [Deltaproteobacteria bacterium]
MQSMKKRRFFLKLFFFILILLFLHSPAGAIETLLLKAEIKPIKGNPAAPLFNLEDLGGKKVSLKQYKGQVVFLNFWATWCGPCKEEMPSMEALYQKFKEGGFAFLAISVDYEEKRIVKEFIQKHRYTFPVLIDPKCVTLDLYGVKGIPTTILIDKKGKMIGRITGPKDWKNPEIENILNQLVVM